MQNDSLTIPLPTPVRRRWLKRAGLGLLAGLSVYLLAAYVVAPSLWQRHERRHPALADAETITRTGSGIPGDPVNVGLVGTEVQLQRAMLAAKWYPADPITLESSLRIAADVVFRRAYVDAPVSSLYLFGRKEDLAFEKPVGADPARRHHVRFWRGDKPDGQGRPLWLGAATLDLSVGFSDDTGQITHHISADVDRQRGLIIDELSRIDALSGVQWIDAFHKQLNGRNGEGDPWHTDGRLAVGEIRATAPTSQPQGRTD